MNININSRASNIIAFFLQDLDGGGAERAIIRLAGEIAELGYSVDLVVGDASDYRPEVSEKINLLDFATRSPFSVFSRLTSYLRYRKPVVIMSALDLANIMLLLAVNLVGFKGRKVISQRAVFDAGLRDLNPIRRMLTWQLIRVCFPHADALISNSHAAALEVKARLDIPADKIFTIQNAIDLTRITQLAQEPLSDHLVLNDTVPLIVSVGSLTKRKDMSTLIQSFALVRAQRTSRLVVVGKGPEMPILESLIKELGLEGSAHLVGFDANPYKWIAAASVFVSSSMEEGFPNVIAEALTIGRSVVATDCPGDTAELLGHGKWGRLVPVGDTENMAEAILAALDDPSPPQGHIRAADFSPSKNAAAYLDVLLPQKSSTMSAFSGYV